MLSEAATALRTLALALWVGGGAALDFVEAPLRFAGGVLDRNQAVGLGQAVFGRWVRVEWALGVIVLATFAGSKGPSWLAWLIVLMLAAVTVQGAYLAPAIVRLSTGLDFVHRTPGDPRYAAIRPLHTASVLCEIVVLLAGAVALVYTVRSARR